MKESVGIYLILFMTLCSCAMTKEERTQHLSNKLCQDVLSKKSPDEYYQDLFTENFRKSVSIEEFKQINQKLVGDYGPCVEVMNLTAQGLATLKTTTGQLLTFQITPDKSKASFQGLFFYGVRSSDKLFTDIAETICTNLSATSLSKQNYKQIFSKQFRKSVPLKTFNKITQSIYKDYKNCESIEIPDNQPTLNKFHTLHPTGDGQYKKLVFSLTVDDKNKEATGLLFKGELLDPIYFTDKNQILNWLEKFNGQKSLYFISEEQGPILNENSETKQALGSVFKLFVLGTLIEEIESGNVNWSQKIPIREEAKSLPSGIMQNFKVGTLVTLQEMAKQMIKISDNTATDHLIDFLGRQKIENFIQKHNFIEDPSWYRPFLKTRELFAMRAFWGVLERTNYVESNRESRVRKLKRLSLYKRNSILNKLKTWTTPNESIYDLEWFANAKNICRLQFWFKSHPQTIVLDILDYTPSTPLGNTYVGYKGGSEPGVLAMSYLIRNQNDEWSCLYMGLNDATSPIRNDKAIQFAESLLIWGAQQ